MRTTQIVKIIASGNPDSWYCDKIGHDIEVYADLDSEEYYETLDPFRHFIRANDCQDVAVPATPAIAMALPADAKARKDVPIFSGVIKYFPRALAAVAALSRVGNEQHNPGKPLHWDRAKSGDELDALTRHLLQAGTVDTDGVLHSTKVCWRSLANLEKELEAASQK